MKTPMQEIENYIKMYFAEVYAESIPNDMREKIKNQIEKEKQMIIDAYESRPFYLDADNVPPTAEQYYNETFKQ